MSYDSVYYWKNFLEKEKENDVKLDSYILNFYIINQDTGDMVYKWHSFQSDKELLGFIKYVVLPSGYHSRIFGEHTGDVLLSADTYNSALDLLYNNIVRVDEALISDFKDDYALLEKVEANFSLHGLHRFCHSFNSHLSHRGIVFSFIDVYENIVEFGRQLIRDYEDQDMIDQLEYQMELSKEEIVDLFENIDKNPFMLKRINEFLNSKFLI